MPPRVRLRHIHLPASPSQGIFPRYQTAAALQELLRRRQLDFQHADSSSSPSNRGLGPPQPTLISFTPQPTYTLGRRQAQASRASLSPADVSRLKAPLRIISSPAHHLRTHGLAPTGAVNNTSDPPATEHIFHPAVLNSPRGGLATYHGPGQVVLWPIMVINSATRALGHKHFTVRCYSRLLERTTISLLRRLFGLQGFTTDHPGVWVRTPSAPSPSGHRLDVASGAIDNDEVRKISALGIHLRRHVSSLGAALNLDMPTTRAAPSTTGAEPDETTNPWARFAACGLAGKGVTCVEEELRAAGGTGIPGLDSEVVARAWAEELAEGMGLGPQAVELAGRDETDELLAASRRDGYADAASGDEL
jgi:lipoyl(octanoyl) transferase 2